MPRRCFMPVEHCPNLRRAAALSSPTCSRRSSAGWNADPFPSEHVHELRYYDRKRIHNLKYYTWVEQQGKTYEEIQAQWYDDDYWTGIQALADPIDRLIEEFNQLTGLG